MSYHLLSASAITWVPRLPEDADPSSVVFSPLLCLLFFTPPSTLIACILVVVPPIGLLQKTVAAVLLHVVKPLSSTNVRIFLILRRTLATTVASPSGTADHGDEVLDDEVSWKESKDV